MNRKLFSGSPAVLPACPKILGPSGPDLRHHATIAYKVEEPSRLFSKSYLRSFPFLPVLCVSVVNRSERVAEKSLRKVETMLRFSVQTETFCPLSTTYIVFYGNIIFPTKAETEPETKLRKADKNLKISAQPETDFACTNHLHKFSAQNLNFLKPQWSGPHQTLGNRPKRVPSRPPLSNRSPERRGQNMITGWPFWPG